MQAVKVQILQHLRCGKEVHNRSFEEGAAHPSHGLDDIPGDTAGEARAPLQLCLGGRIDLSFSRKMPDAIFQQCLHGLAGNFVILVQALHLETVPHQIRALPMVGLLKIDCHMGDIAQVQGVHILVGHAAVGWIGIFLQAKEIGALVHGVLQILPGTEGLITGEDEPPLSGRKALHQRTFGLVKMFPAA